MAANTRSETQREQDMATTWRLHIQGKTQAEIAEVIGVSREQIRYDLAELKQAARSRLVDDVAAARSEELAALEVVEREAWQAWNDSGGRKRRKKTTVEGSVTDTAGDKVETTEWIETGDARYLATVLEARDRRCKILGLYPPQKFAQTNAEGTGPAEVMLDVSGMSEEEQAAIIRLARRAQRVPAPATGNSPSVG